MTASHSPANKTSVLVYSIGSPDTGESPQAHVNRFFCLLSIGVAVGFMIPTAEFVRDY